MSRNPRKGSFARCVKEVSRRGDVDDPRAVCAAAKMKAGEDLHKNPADLAAIAFERFHGYKPTNFLVIETEEHQHEYLPDVGELIDLVIVPEGQRKGVLLHGFNGTRLAMNEKLADPKGYFDQLFLVGGDQSVPLEEFGIGKPHEQELLGKVVGITYFTVKTHLGRDGGEADYTHKFGEESAKRQMRIEVSPTATYHTLNKVIELWGGKYTIEAEGIRN